jgi:hypothetical protein
VPTETEPEVNDEDPGRGKHKGRTQEIISDRTANVIIGVVTTVWAGNILAGMFEVNDYQPSETINGIFMTIVGGAFVLRARSRGGE